MAHLSVVIPVYQAEGFLPELYRRLKLSLGEVTRDHEIVLVEDCGNDRSWEIIEGLARKDKRVKAIQLSRNFGQHYAITAGLDHCDGDWVVVMDCDLQDRPEEIPKLYQKAREGYEVVLAIRMNRVHGWTKRVISWLFYRMFNFLTDLHYDGKVGNFSIISSKVVKTVAGMRENLRFYGGMVRWSGFSVAKVQVQHAASARGGSSYSYRKLLKLGFDAVIAYSDKPLWLTVRFGFGMAIASFFAGCFVIYRAMTAHIPVMGWASVVVSMYLLGGVTISILGIVGIYVGKTFEETKKRPLYAIGRSRNLHKARVSTDRERHL